MKDSRSSFYLTFIPALFVLAATLTLSGCLDADFRLEQAIKEAVAQAEEGNTAAAINKLESLQDKHPNNANISEALAIAYTEHGNYLLASNYYQKSARLSPDKLHLLKLSAEGQIKAGRKEDAASRLENYLEVFPEDGETWLEMGRIQYDLQHKEEAIDALTRGLLLTSREQQRATDHQKLGSLYLERKDYAQADYYLNNALTLADDKTVEGQVLAELVESSIEQEDWDVADVFLKRIASTQPELLNTSEVRELKQTVDEIFSLRDEASRAVIKVELAVPKTEQGVSLTDTEDSSGQDLKTTSSPTEAEAANTETESKAPQDEDSGDEPENQEKEADESVDVEPEDVPADDAIPELTEPAEVSDGVIDNVSTLEAEVTGEDSESSESEEVESAAIDGGLLTEAAESVASEVIEPKATADKASDPVDDSTEGSDENPEITNGSSAEPESEAGEDPEMGAGGTMEEGPEEPLVPYVAPENEAELLLIQAQQAVADGDVPAAIRMSWDSINKRPENPAGWFILSRAYSKFGQDLNAESAALEAMRLNPRNKKIVLNYLGIIQRSRGANRFHDELLKAYQNFSSDPDFVLALARSYARIKSDPQNSAALYRRFFDLAPDHENAAEIRQEASYVE